MGKTDGLGKLISVINGVHYKWRDSCNLRTALTYKSSPHWPKPVQLLFPQDILMIINPWILMERPLFIRVT